MCVHNVFQKLLTESSVNSETVARRCPIKKVFLEILQHSQESAQGVCTEFAQTQIFPVNLAKFLRTPFLTENLRWLLLLFVIYLFNYDSSKSTFFMLNVTFDVLLSTVFVKQIRILRFLFFVSFTCNKVSNILSCNMKLKEHPSFCSAFL